MLRQGLFTAFVLLIVACATRSTPPAHVAGAERAETAEADTADDDGEADAEDTSAEATEPAARPEGTSPCPPEMMLVGTNEARFCVDKYEASLVEVDGEGTEKPYPHYMPVDGHTVRAVSVAGVFPQGFISEMQADDACVASGKRLCTHVEWKTACMGPSKTTFPYGNGRQAGVCHDTGKSAVGTVFGFQRLADPVATNGSGAAGNTKRAATPSPKNANARASHATAASPVRPAHGVTGRAAETTRSRASRTASASAKTDKPSKKSTRQAHASAKSSGPVASRKGPAKASTRPASVEPSVWSQLNDSRLGQVDGALARTGSHEECQSGFGAVDMVGNLHEWVKTDPSSPHGTFAGGYYLDTSINGDGCQYRTTAHAHDYHDYSTGFRCCADAKPSSSM